MRGFIAILLLLGLMFTTSADNPPKYTVTDIKPLEGVFIMATGYSTIVIELKKGNFRYWFSTDVVVTGVEQPKYPLKGKYKIKGNTVILEHKQITQKEWTFRKINTTVTLWRPIAVKFYKEEQKLDSYGILRFTNRTAEKAWNDQSEFYEKSPKSEIYLPPENSKDTKKSKEKLPEEGLNLIEGE